MMTDDDKWVSAVHVYNMFEALRGFHLTPAFLLWSGAARLVWIIMMPLEFWMAPSNTLKLVNKNHRWFWGFRVGSIHWLFMGWAKQVLQLTCDKKREKSFLTNPQQQHLNWTKKTKGNSVWTASHFVGTTSLSQWVSAMWELSSECGADCSWLCRRSHIQRQYLKELHKHSVEAFKWLLLRI